MLNKKCAGFSNMSKVYVEPVHYAKSTCAVFA